MSFTFNLTLEWVTRNANCPERRKKTEKLSLFNDITGFTDPTFTTTE